jgi:hypothetical protein
LRRRPRPTLGFGAKERRRRGCIQKFPDWVDNEITLTTLNTRCEATQRVMAAKLTRLTHKIAIQLHLIAERCTICSSRSKRPVRKLLDTPSYMPQVLSGFALPPVRITRKQLTLNCSVFVFSPKSFLSPLSLFPFSLSPTHPSWNFTSTRGRTRCLWVWTHCNSTPGVPTYHTSACGRYIAALGTCCWKRGVICFSAR